MSDEWKEVERVLPTAPSAGSPVANAQDGWQTVPATAPGFGAPPPPPAGYPVYAPPPQYGALASRRKSHVARNIVLVVLAFVLLGMAGCGAVIYKGMTYLRDSAPTRLAVHTAESSPFVQERIGTPLKPFWFMSGSMHTSLDGGVKTGSANLKVSVTGPKGEGTLYANETLTAGGWKIDSLTYQDAGSGSTPLVQAKVREPGADTF